MYLGRFRIGSHVPLVMLALDGSRKTSVPSYQPVAAIWSDTPSLVETVDLVVKSVDVIDGLFGFDLFLGSKYSTGFHDVHFKWKANGKDGINYQQFEIVAGGNSAGSVNATHWWQRPEANYVISLREDGTLVQGRNPYIDNPESGFG